MTNLRAIGLAGLLAVAIWMPRSAAASAYGIADIDLVDGPTATKLAAMKIDTTLDFWTATRTKKAAGTLARKLGVPATRVQEWRDFCDLLRVDGIGPKVARVLTLSGVRRLSQLASADPAALALKIRQVNAEHQVLGKLPDAENVRGWAEQARKLSK